MYPLLLALAATPAAEPPTPKAECPTWKHYFPSGDCAGKGLYPFEKHPRVTLVSVCDRNDATATGANKCVPWTKEFSSAAHVTFPRFNSDGGAEKGDALIIYEGMRLTVNPKTGEYDLTFTATVPNMPVTLRLQLEFTEPGANGSKYKLTLPPIRMQPKEDAKLGDPSAWTFNIAHRGYSSLLLNPRPEQPRVPESDTPLKLITEKWTVQRHGTARFGTPVAIEDPNR